MKNDSLAVQNSNFINRILKKIKGMFFKGVALPEVKETINVKDNIQTEAIEDKQENVNKINITGIILNGKNIELTEYTGSFLTKFCKENNLEVINPVINLDDLSKQIKMELLELTSLREMQAPGMMFGDELINFIPDGKARRNEFIYNATSNNNFMKFKEKEGTLTDEFKMISFERQLTNATKYIKETIELYDKAVIDVNNLPKRESEVNITNTQVEEKNKDRNNFCMSKKEPEIKKIISQVNPPEEVKKIDIKREKSENTPKEQNKIKSVILSGNEIEITTLSSTNLFEFCKKNNIEISNGTAKMENLSKELKIEFLEVIADRETMAATLIFTEELLDLIPNGNKNKNEFFSNVRNNYGIMKFMEKQGKLTDENKIANLEKIVIDTGKYIKETSRLLDKASENLQK